MGAPDLADLAAQGRLPDDRRDLPRRPMVVTPTKDEAPSADTERAAKSGQLEAQRSTRRTVLPVLTRMHEVQSSPIRWLWAGWLALGKLAVLDGHPGLGKSTLTCDLAARVSRGQLMPGGSPGALRNQPSGVVLVTCEDDAADTLKPRLDAAGADCTRIVHLAEVQDGDRKRMPTLADLDALRAAITEVDAKLVIIDPLMAYLGGDAHRDNEVRSQLGPLAQLAGELGVAILLVRHLTKSGGTHALMRGGGSVGIIGAVRTGWLFAEDPDDADKRVLLSSKSNIGPAPTGWSCRIASSAGSSKVEWIGEAQHTTEQVLAERVGGGDSGSALDAATEWLRRELADRPRPQRDLEQEAKGEFSSATLRRARDVLGVTSRRVSGGEGRGAGHWEWDLPR